LLYENESMDSIVEKIEYAIEQHPSFLKVLSKEEIKEQQDFIDSRRIDGIDYNYSKKRNIEEEE